MNLVRTSASRGKAPGLPESVPASGAIMLGLLARYDRDTSLWKTSQLCLDGGLQTFSETWPRSGMMRSGIAYRLPPLEPPTGGIGSGSWPTPRAEDGESTGMSAKRAATRAPDNLPTAVRMWPTPASRDYRAPNKPDGASRLSRPPTSGEQLPNAVGGVLNPEWVELLMGFPPGHTAIR